MPGLEGTVVNMCMHIKLPKAKGKGKGKGKVMPDAIQNLGKRLWYGILSFTRLNSVWHSLKYPHMIWSSA